MTSLRIGDALPGIFAKAYPVLDPKIKMLPAMSLLRFHEIDALLLAKEAGKKQPRAVGGYSTLARLMLVGPEKLGSFLEQPCETASQPVPTLRADQSLSSLLETFAKTRIGFARVEGKRNVGVLASLSDVLELYETGAIAADLTVEEVGSIRSSMPGGTTMKKALEEMFKKKHRRMFVSGGKEFISDRGIIGRIFGAAVLGKMLHGRAARVEALDIPISSVDKMIPKEVAPNTSLMEAARTLAAGRGGQCLVFGRMVATPWDIVMKPWIAGALKLKNARDGLRPSSGH